MKTGSPRHAKLFGLGAACGTLIAEARAGPHKLPQVFFLPVAILGSVGAEVLGDALIVQADQNMRLDHAGVVYL